MNRFQLALPRVQWRYYNSLYCIYHLDGDGTHTQRDNNRKKTLNYPHTDRHRSPFAMRCASGFPIGMSIDAGIKEIRFLATTSNVTKANIRYTTQERIAQQRKK